MNDTTPYDEEVYLPLGLVIDDRYRIDAVLGQGGFAVVYQAHHTRLNKAVALKVMDLQGSSRDMKVFRDRFEREAQLASKLDAPNVVNIYDYGFVPDSGQPYIAMELLEGVDLEESLVEDGAMSPMRIVPLFLDVLDALGRGHEAGVVHKDLKPSNLFLSHANTPSERLVVLDYGIAGLHDDKDARLTATNQFAGTPAYMAPEYIEYQVVTPQLDIYQMGLILIESLTGEAAIDAQSALGYFRAHCEGHHKVPAHLSNTPLGQVILRAIAVDPAMRWPTMLDFKHALATVDLTQVPSWVGQGSHASGVPTFEQLPSHHQPTQPEAPSPQAPNVSMMMPGEPAPQKDKTNQMLILGGVAAAILIVCAVLGTAVIFLANGKSESSDTSGQTGPLSSLQSPTLNVAGGIKAAKVDGMDAKLHIAHAGFQMLNPGVDLMVENYQGALKKYGWSKPKMIAGFAPMRMSMNFDLARQYLEQARKNSPSTAVLEEVIPAYRVDAKALGELFEDMHLYYRQNEAYKEDNLARGKVLHARFKVIWARYAKSRDAVRHALYTADMQHIKAMSSSFKGKEAPVMVLLAETYGYVLQMMNGALDDPNYALATTLKKAQVSLRKAREIHRKHDSAGPAYMGPRPMLDALSNLLGDFKKIDTMRQANKVVEARKKMHETRGDYHRAVMALFDYGRRQ